VKVTVPRYITLYGFKFLYWIIIYNSDVIWNKYDGFVIADLHPLILTAEHHNMIWYDMIWYDMIWYDMIWYDMIWYDIHYVEKKQYNL
jgi:hypothetical protein